MNILDYLTSYSIYSFHQMPFNEVDSAVLAMLSYLSWEDIVTKTPKTLQMAADKYFQTHETDPAISFEATKNQRRMMLAIIANSKRYKNVLVYDYEKKYSADRLEQFAAMTFQIGLFEYYVSFQGTDGSLVGWREDFDMAYVRPVASQKDAYEYLTRQLQRKGKIRVGGHSKGGNLAIYAAIELDDPRITHIYSFDGPGFREEFTKSELYQRQKGKILHVVPEFTVVGMIMHHGRCPLKVVEATTEDKFQQHNPLLWKVQKDHFVSKDQVSDYSNKIKDSITVWFENLEQADQKVALDLIYDCFADLGIETTQQMLERRKEVMGAIYHSFRNYDKQTKKAIFGKLLDLVRTGSSGVLGAYLFKKPETKEIKNEEQKNG